MSTKTEIVVCGASYRKVFWTIFRRVSFSTATSQYHSLAEEAAMFRVVKRQSAQLAAQNLTSKHN
jgi:hypothetical protein